VPNHRKDLPAQNGPPLLVGFLDHLDNKVRERLQVDQEFVIHSLRHAYLTRPGEAGGDAFAIMQLGGRSDVKMLQRWVRPIPEVVESE